MEPLLSHSPGCCFDWAFETDTSLQARETIPRMTVPRLVIVLAVLSHGPGPAGTVLKAQSAGLPQGARNILTYSTYLGGSSNDTVQAEACRRTRK